MPPLHRSIVPFALVACLGAVASPAVAQRDSPVWESYLASTVIQHGENQTLDLSLLYKKEGGPHEHTHHQMYVLGYLAEHEKDVLEVISDPKLIDKTSKQPQFLDVLQARNRAIVLGSMVAKRGAFTSLDVSGKYQDGSDQSKDALTRNAYEFRFSLKKQLLFDAAASLGLDKDKGQVYGSTRYFDPTLKLLLFVPVNDSKWATGVPKKQREFYDFTFDQPGRKVGIHECSQHYCRPLPLALCPTTSGNPSRRALTRGGSPWRGT